MTALGSSTLMATTNTPTKTFHCDSRQHWTVLYPSICRIYPKTWRQQRQLKEWVVHVEDKALWTRKVNWFNRWSETPPLPLQVGFLFDASDLNQKGLFCQSPLNVEWFWSHLLCYTTRVCCWYYSQLNDNLCEILTHAIWLHDQAKCFWSHSVETCLRNNFHSCILHDHTVRSIFTSHKWLTICHRKKKQPNNKSGYI